MNLHILSTCLNPSRIYSALLVFKTLRVGFPSSDIFVYGNNLDPRVAVHIKELSKGLSFSYRQIAEHSHGEWIEKLIKSEHEPFWICDTDVVLLGKVEGWFRHSEALFAGRYESEFLDPWTRTIHMARLHPSLMWINPVKLRAEIRGWPGKHNFLTLVDINLIRWHWVPELGKRLKFYDTCSGLHHAFEGTRFTEEQNSRFSHMFCGSYSDMGNDYKAIYENPELARGLWTKQQQWFAEHAA